MVASFTAFCFGSTRKLLQSCQQNSNTTPYCKFELRFYKIRSFIELHGHSRGYNMQQYLQETTEMLNTKTCPSATLSSTNSTRTGPGSNLALRGDRLATDRLSHGTAPDFGPQLHENIHVVSEVLGSANTFTATPRQTAPKILATHDTDPAAL
jgi:hypothetical protein